MTQLGNGPMHRVVRLALSLLSVAASLGPVACQAGLPGPAVGLAVLAQFPPAPGMAARNRAPEPDVFPRPERALLRQLANAKDLIAQRRWAEAVRCLDVILQSPEDYLYQPDEKQPLHRSLRSEANRIVGEMPEEGREVYELQYGSRARQLLDRAVKARDRDLLDGVSRRFFHTAAGREATFLLGLYDLDHGEPLAAALTLQQLCDEAASVARFEPALSLSLATCWRQAGLAEKAKSVLGELSGRRGGSSVLIAGREESVVPAKLERLAALIGEADASPVDASRALSEWTQPRGNPARTAAVEASRPLLEPVWRIPTTENPLAENLLAVESQYRVERAMPMLPSLQPLALDGVVLMRSLRTLVAVDCRTGKRLWEAPADDVLSESPDAYRAIFPQPGELAGRQCQRVWQDALYGALASDGRRVLAIEDLGISLNNYGRRPMVQGGHRVAGAIWPTSTNRLAAYDIGTGKLVWHLGGSREEYGLDLAGTFFLGAPLAMSDRLYQLAERDGEIRLVCLESATGKVLWSQRIALVEQSILESPLRRLSAVSPSYRDGILVCPTAAGAIVGVKLARRSLLWGYGYTPSPMTGRSPAPFATVSLGSGSSPRWTDASLVLADDRVLATPPDSDEIHCLNLLDGKLLWKKPRGEGLYLAAVLDRMVVLVGVSRVWALSLDDGAPAWGGRVIDLPEGSVVSGQGFRTGKLYYLPTGAAEILVLDLEAGRIREKLVSPTGTVPGNLVCYRDKIISQGIEGVAAFDQIEPLSTRIAQRLAENPDDAEALRRKGQILLASGQRTEGVECLRRSYRIEPGQKCRQQLREALLDGLRDEFAQYGSAAAEIEGLLDEPRDRMRYRRLMAIGLQSESAWKPALEHYLRLADACGEASQAVEVERGHLVREDRWLAARLAEFRESAPADVTGELDRWLRERLDTALRDKTTTALARFTDCFRGQPQAAEAENELIGRYLAAGELLKAETLLSRRIRSGGPEQAAATMFQLAGIFEKAGRVTDAAACYCELEERWADVVCHDGKTGRQVVASLDPKSPLAAALHPERLWPGAVRVTTPPSVRPNVAMRASAPLAFQRTEGPFFRYRSAAVDQSGRQLLLLDGFGREQWRVAVPGIDRYSYARQYVPRLSARGHLLLVSLGSRVVAIDGGPRPRVLWDKSVMGARQDVAGGTGVVVQGLGGQLGPQIIIGGIPELDYSPDAQPLGALTEDYVCCHRFRRCVALDPISGQTLWSRADLPTRATVFGDASHVFLVPSDRNEAIVLRASDGERLEGTKAVPPRPEWIATLGGAILRWHLQEGKFQLDLFDPWTQKSLWGPHSFSSDARHYLLGDDAIGVMQGDGQFSLFTLPDGRKRVDAKLAPEPALDGIVLFDSPAGYMLVTSATQAPARPNAVRWRPFYGGASKLIQAGRVYAFDRSGTSLWPERPQGVPLVNQQLLLNQPAWLPVLTFASQTYTPSTGGIQWLTSVLMIDRRTGREAVKGQYKDQMTQTVFSGDPTTKTVSFPMRQTNLTLTFSDRPLPPRGQGDSTKESKGAPKGNEALGGILKILKKASGGR